MDEVKLLPCPFCASQVFLEEGYGTDPSASILHLARNGGHDCLLADGVSDWNCESDIVTLWNTRAIEATRPTEQGLGVTGAPLGAGGTVRISLPASAMKDAASD